MKESLKSENLEISEICVRINKLYSKSCDTLQVSDPVKCVEIGMGLQDVM